MRYLTTVALLVLGTGLCASLFWIGRLNLRNTHVHEELNACAEELSQEKKAYVECRNAHADCIIEWRKNSDEMREAIERSTEYCRG